jgi:hypothetical protein
LVPEVGKGGDLIKEIWENSNPKFFLVNQEFQPRYTSYLRRSGILQPPTNLSAMLYWITPAIAQELPASTKDRLRNFISSSVPVAEETIEKIEKLPIFKCLEISDNLDLR